MPRPRQRVRLESGLKLDLNRLCQKGLIQPGSHKASGISFDQRLLRRDCCGHHRRGHERPRGPALDGSCIQIGSLDQRIQLVARHRHFGGWQWYFICPYRNRRVSVLWKPPGAREFACRQEWGKQVAYSSQFLTPRDRAHRGMTRINARLCSIGGLDPDQWDLPPRPKWMRWATYNRAVEKFDRYEVTLNEGLMGVLARFMKLV